MELHLMLRSRNVIKYVQRLNLNIYFCSAFLSFGVVTLYLTYPEGHGLYAVRQSTPQYAARLGKVLRLLGGNGDLFYPQQRGNSSRLSYGALKVGAAPFWVLRCLTIRL